MNKLLWYKFSECATENMPIITQEHIIEKIQTPFCFWYDNIKNWFFKIDWWYFDCRFFLKKYIVKTQYGLFETYDIDKTNLRENTKWLWEIIYILQIDNI